MAGISPAPFRAPPPALDLGQKSIRVQLALLVLGIVLPAFVVAVTFLLHQRDAARSLAGEKVALLAFNTAQRLASRLREHALTMAYVAAQPSVRAMDPARCERPIQDLIGLNPEYLGIGTRDLRGAPVCIFRREAPTAQQMMGYAWFTRSLDNARFQASDAFLVPIARRWTSMLTTPVRDDADRLVGVVVLPIDLLRLGESVLAGGATDTLVTVLDSEFRIIMRSLDAERWIGRETPGSARVELLARPEGLVRALGADGVDRLFAFRQVEGSAWRVTAGVPVDVVYASADRALRNGILACVLLLVVALAVAWRLGRAMVRPLDALVTTAARVAGGDVMARVPLLEGAPEFTSVALGFNQMLDARTAAEAALRSSQEKLSITLESIGDGVIATDPQGNVTRMNAAAQRLTGWALADARGRTLQEVFRVVDASTQAPVEDLVQKVIAQGEATALTQGGILLGRDGSEYRIADKVAPILDHQRNVRGVVLVFSDVSEQYRLQRNVQESENRYRMLVESSPVGVLVHQEGSITYVNAMACRILGAQTVEALMGRPFLDFVHADDRPLALWRARAIAAQGLLPPTVELRCVRLDGAVIDVQAQAIPVEVQGRRAIQVSVMDITARKCAERSLRDNEERFRALTELSSDWYWEQDAQFRFVRIDGHLQEILGRPNAALLGKMRWEIQGFSLGQAQWDAHRAILEAHQPFRDFQMHSSDANGRNLWVAISGAPILDANGTFLGYRGVGRDITAEKTAADQIHALAFYDALTELPNRRLLVERLKQALAAHARTRRQAALLFIDLDNFKTLNDTLGHETGDQLLQQVAQRIVACTRETDTVARLGGDEFVVMLEDLSEDLQEATQQAKFVGNKILAAFDPAFVLGTRSHRSTPSIGITLFGKGGKSVDDLLKHADLAMYQAKGAGRNTLRMFDQGMQAAVDGRAAMESELREGLLRGQMRLAYQPVVQLDGRVIGAEALVRWQHPVRGLVSPGEFIALAESTRLIIPLGQWVLQAACRQLTVWRSLPHMAHLTVAVNVSANQFKEPEFVESVFLALHQSGADPRLLKLELTESLLADNVEDIIAKMTRLRAVGIDFSLDDFGTGYSSLSYLKRLPLAQLKIDQSFVRDVLVDPNDAAIARTIVALGGSLGLAVIAEGVETVGQQQFLQGIGCHAFQGYLFGRPMPAPELDAFVLAHAATATACELP